METPVTILILLVTGVVTFIAFQRPDLRDRWIFNPHAILRHRQYGRMLTSGLIHADWRHFIFNAFSFYCFGREIENIFGGKVLLLIYLASILGGSALSLAIHRHHEYRALGASGGVCGVIFASIFLLPGGSIFLFLIPVPIPAYVYAVGFLVLSFVAHRRQRGNVGHDAHLGGAIVGLLTATALYPDVVFAEPEMFAAVLVISAIILLVLLQDPLQLLERHFEPEVPVGGGDERTREYEENRRRLRKQEEIDRLLDKVAKRGLPALSAAERQRLDTLSKEVYGRG